MSWGRAATYWAICLVLGALYATMAVEPGPPAAATVDRAPFLQVPAASVVGLDVRRDDQVVRCRKLDDRWQVVEPPGLSVPHDLVSGLVSSVTDLPDVEVVSEGSGTPGAFGVDPPASTLMLTRSDGAPISVRLGAKNPAGTAVYAQKNDDARVYLIGLNIRYYEELLFEALRR